MVSLTVAAEQIASSSLTGASVVSVCALLFTVASFWWLHARQGRLRAWEPHSFAAIIHGPTARLRLPLILHNTGPKPIVVQNVILTFPDDPASHLPLLWVSSPSRLQPEPDEEAKLPAGFVVPGREAQQLFLEFEAPFSAFLPEARDYKAQIQVRVGHRRGWRPLLTFTLRAANIVHPDRYTVYSNAPVGLTKEDQRRADAALLELLEEHEDSSPPGDPPRDGGAGPNG
ncbi:hypothetical protein [Streptomyces collinus]|uniref:hypothetical protein n=1 Tax=Streptomyces collinus TaxID=42684 RepID=UPI00332BEBF7